MKWEANCRWVTQTVQMRNMSRNVFLTVDGIKRTVVEWSEITGITAETIHHRIKKNWLPKKIITTPPGPSGRRNAKTKSSQCDSDSQEGGSGT
jgi:hypothetical protein